MIDIDLTKKKSRKKTSTRYGLSVVYMIRDYSFLESIQKSFDAYDNFFVWNKTDSYHITFIRCHSSSQDFCFTGTEEICKALSSKKSIELQGKSLKLGIDGVLRYNLSGVPSGYWRNSDLELMQRLTGMQFSIIMKPWITLAYTKETEINNVVRCYAEIQDSLANMFHKVIIPINQLDIVKYFDTSFSCHKIIDSVLLR